MTNPRQEPGNHGEHARVDETRVQRANLTGQQPRTSSTGISDRDVDVDTNNPNQEAWIGTDRPNVSAGNASWGGIIAGVFTFLALVVLLALGAAALGLQDAGGWALGLWTLIGLAVAFLVAGYVTGALAVRAGLFNGFLTWAVSLIAVLFMVGWLGTSIVGAVGNVVGTTAESAAQAVSADPNQVQEGAQDAAGSVDQQDVDQAQQQAEQTAQDAAQTAQEVAPETGAGIWWTLFGLIIGAVLSAVGGGLGARGVVNKREENVQIRR